MIPLDNCYEVHQKKFYTTMCTEIVPDSYRWSSVFRKADILG